MEPNYKIGSKIRLYNGDCLDVMSKLKDSSIDVVLADIPYSEVNRKSNGLRNLDNKKEQTP